MNDCQREYRQAMLFGNRYNFEHPGTWCHESIVLLGGDIRLWFASSGYRIEEFRFVTLARRLEEVATEDNELFPELQFERRRDVLRCLFDLSRFDEDLAVIRTPVRVITTGGSLLRADQCYFGQDYEGQRTAYDLYHSFNRGEFVSRTSTLGLDDKAPAQVIEFLKRLGVLDQPHAG